MKFDTRVTWWLIGCVVGFTIGYVVRSLRELKEQVTEVDKHVTEERNVRDEGFTKNDWVTNVALFLVVVLTLWASFSSQKSSDKVKDTQASQSRVVTCTQTFLVKTLAALNARTEFTKEQSDANVTLQKAQGEFLGVFIVKKPPVSMENFSAALTKYYASLSTYLAAATKNSGAIATNPYPTPKELSICLKGK